MFSTEIKRPSVYGLNKLLNINDDEVLIINSKVAIEFDIEPEYRSWGIKSNYCNFNKILITIDWDSKDKSGTLEEEIVLGGIYKIENDVKFGEDGSYSINECEIDFDKKIIIFY